MLSNTLKNEKFKKTKKIYGVFLVFFWFYWASFLMPTLVLGGLAP